MLNTVINLIKHLTFKGFSRLTGTGWYPILHVYKQWSVHSVARVTFIDGIQNSPILKTL